MKLEDIKFKQIKKISGSYISKAFYQNTNISIDIKHLTLKKTLYRKNNRIYLNISFDKTEKTIKTFDKLKNYTINYIYEQHKEQATLEEIQSNYINNIKENDTEYIVRFEVNKTCLFTQKNNFDEVTGITHKDITENDNIDITIMFNGILYGKSNFTNNYIITKLTKHIEEISSFEECCIETDEDEEQVNDEIVIPNLGGLCIDIDEIPELE